MTGRRNLATEVDRLQQAATEKRVDLHVIFRLDPVKHWTVEAWAYRSSDPVIKTADGSLLDAITNMADSLPALNLDSETIGGEHRQAAVAGLAENISPKRKAVPE